MRYQYQVHGLQDDRRNFFYVFLILIRDQDSLDTPPMSRQNFFLQPSDRENPSPERDFTSHRNVWTHWNAANGGNQRGRHRDSCGRTILRDCALGNMNVNVYFLIKRSEERRV